MKRRFFAVMMAVVAFVTMGFAGVVNADVNVLDLNTDEMEVVEWADVVERLVNPAQMRQRIVMALDHMAVEIANLSYTVADGFGERLMNRIEAGFNHNMTPRMCCDAPLADMVVFQMFIPTLNGVFQILEIPFWMCMTCGFNW